MNGKSPSGEEIEMRYRQRQHAVKQVSNNHGTDGRTFEDSNMNHRDAFSPMDACMKQYIARDSARLAPAEDRTRLYLLAYLLTADSATAERCFVPGLEPAAEDNAALRDWTHSWARRIVICKALQLIAPEPERGNHEFDSEGSR